MMLYSELILLNLSSLLG